jgi:DNA modification methylase
MKQELKELIEKGGKSDFEIIAGQKILVKRGQFWIQKQRQGHSLHYVVPYQACFAPQIPEFFIKHFSKEGDIVLDPFCGRGTTVLEANQQNRIGLGVDVSPLALEIAKSKLKNVTYEQVKKRLSQIDFSKEILEGYEEFKDIYHPQTYSQIMNLKKQLTDSPVDTLIKAVIFGRLHGHSNGFFSVWTFNVISFSKERIKRQSEKRGLKPDFRDVVPRILKKAKTVLEHPVIEQPKSKLFRSDSRKLPIENNSVDLIVTSPPFLDVINYIDDNWLRFWFLGFDRDQLRNTLIQTGDIEEYKNFIRDSLKEMNRVLKKGKYCIVEVGDVRHKSKKIYLDHLIVELAKDLGFQIEKIIINYMEAPKISKAFRRKEPGQGTQTNRCVIMKKI